MALPTKSIVYRACKALVQQRIDAANTAIAAAREATANESKSTAGDKHETGRAMAQLEQEKHGQMLAQGNKLMQVLHRIDGEAAHKTVQLGSLVQTDKGWFFLAVAVGRFEVNETAIFGLSPASPVGKLLMGLSQGEHYTFNGVKITVHTVL